MADSHGAPKHPYHLVDPSPWPALGALGAFLLAFGAAIGMHPDLFKEVLGHLFDKNTAATLATSSGRCPRPVSTWW